MIKVGLTGSIGMGKSTVASMFAEHGALVWCADDAVHRMYEKGGAAIAPLTELFPEAIVEGAVDRSRFASCVLGKQEHLQKLEAVVHPLVAADREAFMTAAAHAGAKMVVLDIPLLFENGSEELFDVVVVVSAPAAVQRERVLARAGMNDEKLKAILAQQMPDAEKRKRANYVISTDRSIEKTKIAVSEVYSSLMARARQEG